jgi:hypothetical protein
MCMKLSGTLLEAEGGERVSSRAVLGVVVALVTVAAAAIRLAVTAPAEQLLDLGIALLGALGVGWAGRSIVHVPLLYFWPLPKGKPHRFRLMAVSLVNVSFTGFWLMAVAAMLRESDAMIAAAVLVAVGGLVFVLSMLTHSAAQEAGYDRGSEWMRRQLRDRLEPGRSTWLGWLLIVLIELRSKEEHLSTFVGGTLALLLVAAALIAPSVVQEVGDPSRGVAPTEPGDNRAGRTAPAAPLRLRLVSRSHPASRPVGPPGVGDRP